MSSRRTGPRCSPPNNAAVGILADPNTSGLGSLGVYGIGQDVGVRGDATGGNATGVVAYGGVSNGAGVAGISGGSGGHGVTGAGSGSGAGVFGTAGTASGVGVHGTTNSASSTGMLAEHTAGGTALKVSGTAAFSRSGVLTVAAGKSSATVTGVTLSAASLVIATLQQNLPGVYVRAAVPKITGSSFTVYLSKAPTATAKVAWFIVD